MDSLSQAALGAAVAVAAMGRRTALWRAAAFGAVAGTLPDLDVFIDHGDAVLNMVLHRAETHALFWLTLFSLPLGWGMAALARERPQWRRWWLAAWLALITHPLLDAMTIYGTQLFLPLSSTPVGVGSLFIIDPAYTLPLLIGTLAATVLGRRAAALRVNAAGLALSTAYIGWSAAAQVHVQQALQALGEGPVQSAAGQHVGAGVDQRLRGLALLGRIEPGVHPHHLGADLRVDALGTQGEGIDVAQLAGSTAGKAVAVLNVGEVGQLA
jgi:inner membrane protein